jgi:hypothetical protein
MNWLTIPILHRLLFLAAAVAILSCPAVARRPDFHLQVVPAVVYKADDPGNTRTSSFVFDVAMICSVGCELTPVFARIELASSGTTVERQEWTAEMLGKIKGLSYRVNADTPISSPRRLITLPEAFDLHFYVRRPQALAIDSADIHVTVTDAKGQRAEETLKIPVQYYRQKTTLIVPFRGHGIVGQDWITIGGHGGFHGGDLGAEFGVDLDGLDQKDGELSETNENASDAGWGREILAPAAGTVIYARNDVPDNPHPSEDPGLYNALPNPIMAAAGNCVVIDHGNSEYSVLMHMQLGSVQVKAGDKIAGGQVIGKMGNSGNAFGPHLHYQLQSGPRLFQDQGLPFRFQNIDGPLYRGKYFVAK